MPWQLKIKDPSGETRFAKLLTSQNAMTLGRSHQSTIILKDPTVPLEAAILSRTADPKSPFWIKIPQTAPAGHLGDIAIREAHIPYGVTFQLGETQFSLEPISEHPSLPPFPAGVRPWLTCSDAGKETLWSVRKSAMTPLAIYLGGETGTGKEVMANLIHAWSQRKSGPFVPLHCGALPASLVESELFGHVKGAFTGALQHRAGAFLQAHGGTLFLDEIGDLSLDIQVKLLRFLENGEIRPVGSDRISRADVRIICATHHPLKQLVQEGKFRQDLYFRLASITLSLPTLRSRPQDIQLLAEKFAAELGHTLSQRALLRLQAHTWPGNVRELRHAIERASGFAGILSPMLNEEAFEFLLTPDAVQKEPALELGASVLSLHEMERVVLLKALRLSHGNRARAAKILGVARSTLFEMLKRHKIQGPRSHSITDAR